jgi:hypothetical protein
LICKRLKRRAPQATKQFPQERQAKRDLLLARVKEIGPILQASGGKSEELATLAPEAVRRCEARACLD